MGSNDSRKQTILKRANPRKRFLKLKVKYLTLSRCPYHIETSPLMFSGGRERMHWEQMGQYLKTRRKPDLFYDPLYEIRQQKYLIK